MVFFSIRPHACADKLRHKMHLNTLSFWPQKLIPNRLKNSHANNTLIDIEIDFLLHFATKFGSFGSQNLFKID